MSNEDWFYAKNDEQLGPLSFEDLHQLVSSQELGRNDLVWQVGTAGWVPVSAVTTLCQAAGGDIPQVPALPRATFEQQYGPRLQDLRSRVGSLDKSTSALETLPHLRLISRLFQYVGRQVGVDQLDLADRLMKRTGSLAYMLAAVSYAAFFVVTSLQADSIQQLLATALIVIPSASLCHYIAVHFLETSADMLRLSPSELSSKSLSMSVGLLTGTCGLLLLALVSHDLFKKINVVDSILALPLALLLLYAAAASLNPSSLNLAVADRTGAAREAIGISMFLIKALLRLVPIAFGLYSLLAAGSAIFFVYQLSGDALELSYSQARVIAPMALMVGLLPMGLYLAAVFGVLLVDSFRAPLDTADSLGELVSLQRASERSDP